MRIKIETETRRGLRIIGEIPNIPLCRIEGYNGIGKTNAIKLLDLCAGGQPFAGRDHSWKTFRSQLKSARVVVSDMNGANEVEWKIDTSRWPEAADPLGGLIGTIRIDGKPARPEDISSLLSVHHIVAADAPVSVLIERISNAQKRIHKWDELIGREREEKIELVLGELQNRINACIPSQLARDLTVTAEAEKLANSLARQTETARRHIELLDKAVEVATQLTQVRGRGSEMDDKIQELAARIDSIDEQRKVLDGKIKRASAQKHLSEKAEREFDNAQKYLIRQEKSFRTLRSHLQHLAAVADVEPSETDLTAARRAVSQHLNRLTDKLPRVHSTPILVKLLNELAINLESAEQEDLGDTVLIDSDGDDISWTVTTLKEAFQHQAEILAEETPSADAEHLTKEIDKTRGRLDAIAQVEAVLEEVESAQDALTKAEYRLRKATNDLPEHTAQTLEELMQARNALDEESRTVQGDHARLSHARELLGGGKTEEALATELMQLCREANVDAARLRRYRESKQDDLEELVRREAQAAQQAELARHTSSKRVFDVTATSSYLSQSSEASWLRRAVPKISSLPNLSSAEQAETLAELADVLDRARNSLGSNFSSIRGIETALGQLSSRISRSDGQSGKETISDRASKLWLANEVRQWFDSEVVRTALFEGGRDVKLDPESLQISWVGVGGELNERPLAAFSSGQQAFAYTQAQVANLDRDENAALNRLIALDEFGSFIDAKNMSALASYLKTRQVQAPNDQVLVILPLEISPEMASSNRGTDERVSALRQRGYFAEAFQL